MAAEKLRLSLDGREDLGVEFGRILAAYGVVVIHTSFGRGTSMSVAAESFTRVFFFAVPFFLTTSYYYAWKSLEKRSSWAIVKGRFGRLVGPYLIWTTIYLLARLALYVARNDFAGVRKLIGATFESIFFGSAAVQLYYIPLLCSGLLWVGFVDVLGRKRLSTVVCGAGMCAGLMASAWLTRSGNAFGPGSIGFEALIPQGEIGHWRWVRFPLMTLAGVIQTAPAFFGAGLIYSLQKQERFCMMAANPVCGWVGIALVLTVLIAARSIPQTASIAGIGLLGSLLMVRIRPNLTRIVKILGSLSAGCYFSHHLILEAFQITIRRFLPDVTNQTELLVIVILSVAATTVTFLFLYKLQSLGRVGRFIAVV